MTMRTTYRMRVGWSPMRTASVFLPATVSVGMSRRLLITSRAVARQPTATAQGHTTQGSPGRASLATRSARRPSRPWPPGRRTRTRTARRSRSSRRAWVRRCRASRRRSRRRPPAAATRWWPRPGPARPAAATPKEAKRRLLDRGGRLQARADQADRAHPGLVVGALACRRCSRWRSWSRSG